MAEATSVLIVERSGETREVLRTVLAHRGFQVWEASRAEEGLALARKYSPDVVVIDLDEQPASACTASDELSRLADARSTTLIMLGTLRRTYAHDCRFIAKPYHYQPLVSRIEQLLQARGKRIAS